MRNELAEVLTNYSAARTEPLTDHPLAAFIGHDLRDAVREMIASDSYKITGSPGRGNWAETPWVAVFDPLVTETAQRGFYVVYLFRGDGEAVYLSLNQGTTEFLSLVGRARYIDALQAKARERLGLLAGNDTGGLQVGPIDLSGTGDLSRGYEAGNIVALRYEASDLPSDDEIATDLVRFLALYETLVGSGDRMAEDADPAAVREADRAGIEAAKQRWHLRTERNPRLANAAKGHHGATCMVCGFNFEDRYGELGVGYIEAHHLTPFADLRGRPTQLDAATDFIVVCPNCHRMLHRRTPPLPPEELVTLLRPSGGWPWTSATHG